MKPFAVVRSMFNYMGYSQDDDSPVSVPRNYLLITIFWIGTWYYSLPALLFFIYEAKTFTEYSDSFYFVVDGFLFVAIWPIFLCFKPKFIELIDDFEQLIQTRN